MELPSWFQSAMEQRIHGVMARIERHSKLSQYRIEEREAWEALFVDMCKYHLPEFINWEDKHHFRQALESEMLYLQGMRDGAQLILAMCADPLKEDMKCRESDYIAE